MLRTFEPALRLTFCIVASECHDPSLYNVKEPLEITMLNAARSHLTMRVRGQVVTWQCSHVIEVKVIFVVMNQLMQLQRKPRKKNQRDSNDVQMRYDASLDSRAS